MKKWFNHLLVSFIFLSIIGGCEKRDLVIKPLSPYSWSQIDTIEKQIIVTKVKHFFVDNFDYNDSSHIKQLNHFASQQLDSDYNKYSHYTIYFYKKTATLNEMFVDDEHDELAWHSDDELAGFTWVRGEPLNYHLYKNGDCINCSGIYITTPAK